MYKGGWGAMEAKEPPFKLYYVLTKKIVKAIVTGTSTSEAYMDNEKLISYKRGSNLYFKGETVIHQNSLIEQLSTLAVL